MELYRQYMNHLHVQGLWQSLKQVTVSMTQFWTVFPDYLDTSEKEKEELNILFAEDPAGLENR